jgi:hypothetical protein
MSKTILQTTIMISQIYEKYMCYLNTNQECQAFRNYYDLREKIVSGWIHENAEEFAEIWEIVKYNEIHEFSSSIYMRHPNCDNLDLEGPYEIPNYVGCVLPSAQSDYFKPSRSSAQPHRAFELSRSSAEPYDGTTKFHFDYNILQGGGSSAQQDDFKSELNYENLVNFKPSRSSAQTYRDSELSRSTAEPYDSTTKFHFDYDILQGGDNSYGCSYNSYGGSSVRETNQSEMTLSELEEGDDEMPELMEMEM